MAQHGDVVVVGAGLAGLCSAVVLARGGRQVTVFEGASTIGGRARTQGTQDFAVNLGPHALYRRGRGRAILGELGVPVRGAVPRADGIALRGAVLHRLPTRASTLLKTDLLSWPEKLDFARVLGRLPRLDATVLDDVSVATWLERVSSRPRVREVLAALIRVSTYADDTQSHSAGAALGQLQRALLGVLYLDGGWQTLVDGLRDAALAAGAQVVSGRRVARVDMDGDRVTGVSMDDGRREAAGAVVLTGAPQDTAALVPGAAGETLRAAARRAQPVTAACLDVALHTLPRPERLFALGIDAPLYFSVHSATAALAPAASALVHVARYGGAADVHASSVRAQLEGVMDALQPGWRTHMVFARFTPHLTVCHALPLAAQGGLQGRPPVDVSGVSGLYVAGDWVGPEGLLADASLASGYAAAQAMLRSQRAANAPGDLLATA